MQTLNRKYALFVHDLFLEIGHSNALIETVRNLPKEEVDEVVVVAFTTDDIEKLFGILECNLKFVKVPFPKLYPMLVKAIFFHIWAYVYSKLFLGSHFKIGVGIAAVGMDLVNIQFIHHQWNKLYFDMLKPAGFKKIYKKLLFWYYDFIEQRVFRNRNTKFLALSQFINDYCQSYFKVPSDKIDTIYSGINLQKFRPVESSRSDLAASLIDHYPELAELDLDKPIYLFVGAFERKGLSLIMEKFKSIKSGQLIIVGSPESSGNFIFSPDIKSFHIKFTKDLPSFYTLADAFVFASVYEPFGLVIIEAAAMGCEIFVTQKDVGSVELLHDLEGVHIFEDSSDFRILEQPILSLDQRMRFRKLRLDRLQKYSWQKTGRELFDLIRK